MNLKPCPALGHGPDAGRLAICLDKRPVPIETSIENSVATPSVEPGKHGADR
jgi:hypothetical protein